MNPNPAYGSQRLETTLRPELALHLTQEMRLRLQILQANILTLEGMLDLELQQNPALEIIEDDGEDREEAKEDKAEDEAKAEVDEADADTEMGVEKEFSIDDFYPDSYGITDYSNREEREDIGSACADRSSLEEHMLQSIASLFSTSETEYGIARHILDCLDDDGFLQTEDANIAEELEADVELVREVKCKIQRTEPVGIATRDIRQALLVQLEAKGYSNDDVPVRIIAECFDELLQRRITSISNKLRMSNEKITEAFEIIAGLDPKPGRNFRERPRETILPDITVLHREGKLEVSINESPLPPLRLSWRVRQILENPTRFKKSELEFARKKLENARLFIKGILQRRDTLSRMAKEILVRNYDFFSGQVRDMKPLLMKDIADTLELHPSTISRAVRDKYIETPVGIFPLRSFFSKLEKNPVLLKLELIIKNEDEAKPLTDTQITERLNEMGISISRRTVAKYRLKLNIPDCYQRKALAR